jgi:hypothetical protein
VPGGPVHYTYVHYAHSDCAQKEIQLTRNMRGTDYARNNINGWKIRISEMNPFHASVPGKTIKYAPQNEPWIHRSFSLLGNSQLKYLKRLDLAFGKLNNKEMGGLVREMGD